MKLPSVGQLDAWLQKVALHPFLLALYPVLFFYLHNSAELHPVVTLKPIGLTLTLTAVLFLVGYALTRNWLKSALLTSWFLIVFFGYSHVYGEFGNAQYAFWRITVTSSKLINYSLLLLALAGVAFLILTKRPLRRATQWFNVMAFLLVIISLVQVVPHLFEGSSGNLVQDGADSQAGTVQNKPDIYYFIFDRYANPHTLQDQYGYDDSGFVQSLTNLGFNVLDKATGNYPNTKESLASSLNLNYLDGLADRVGRDNPSVTPIFDTIKDNSVIEFLQKQGYKYYNVGSWWEATRTNPHATKNYVAEQTNLGFDEFTTRLLIEDTPLVKIIHHFTPTVDITHHDRIEYQMKVIPTIPKEAGPKFVFAHILLPHDPYVFDKDCKEISPDETTTENLLSHYLGQLTCANQKIPALLQQIIQNSPTPPVIIAQSDEGPHPILHPRTTSSWLPVSTEGLQEKLRILNAVYTPGETIPEFTPNQTPVNTFRILFNHYFKTNYPLLPNKSFVFEDEEHPYRFVDVTDRVAFP